MHHAPGHRPLVTASLEVACEHATAEGGVVLVVEPGRAGAVARAVSELPGRVPLMVGDVGDPALWRAGAEMAGELAGH